MSLKISTARNLGYTAGINVAGQILNVISLLLLANILEPRDFGIVAIAQFVLNAIVQISDLGIMSAIIHRQDTSRKTVSTGVWIRLGFALVSYGFIALTVPLWAPVFGNASEITGPVRIMSLIIIISGFGFASQVKLNAGLEFKKIALAQFLQALCYAVTSLTLAFLGFAYWSIILGHVISWIVWTGAMYALAPVRVGLFYDRKIAGELLSYGKHVLASALVIFAITNIDNFIIGATLGLTVLGYYDIAYRWGTLGAVQITQVINRVMFPTYARIQNDLPLLKQAYLKTVHYVAILSIPTALGLMAIAPEFIDHVIGDKWRPSLWPLIVLCIFGLIRSISGNSGSVFKAVGRPDLLFKISLVSLILKLIFIPIFIYLGYGILGVAFVITSTSILITQLNLYYSWSLTDTTLLDFIRAVRAPFASSLIMLTGILLLKAITGFGGLWYVALLVLFGILVYGLAMFLLARSTAREIMTIAGSIWRKGGFRA